MPSRVLIRFTKNMSKQFQNPSFSLLKMKELRRGISSLTNPPVRKNETTKFKTMSELKEDLVKAMGIDTAYSAVPINREHLLQYLPKSQKELPVRSMEDSFSAALIPLSTDPVLQDKYTTFLGRVRIGRLLEDMDIFAVYVVYQHIFNPNTPKDVPFPYSLVTALVDRIDFTDFVPKPKEDIKISGHVSWVGSSSLEVVVWLEQLVHGTWYRITRALFVIASRDSKLQRSAAVNAIKPANERELEIFSGGEIRKRTRMHLQQKHVSKVIPDPAEQQIIHNLYLRTKIGNELNLKSHTLPQGCVWMKDCALSNIMPSHPEDRNLHNYVFGGFLMRQAEELSWVACYMFSKYRPKLRSISDINFQKPVAVNSLIQMHAHVVYTSMQYIQLITYIETYNPVNAQSETTNTFHFTYEVPDIVPEVVPESYDEAMMYIDGRRHFNEIMKKDENAENFNLITKNKL